MKSMEWGGLMYCIKDCDSVIVNGPTWDTDENKDSVTNALGERFLGQEGNPGTVTLVLWPQEVHAGRGPIYHEPYGVDREKYKEQIIEYEKQAEGPWITMLDRAGLDIFNDRLEQVTAYVGARPGGGVKIDEGCATTLPGLYAAGDASGCGLGGAAYPAGGTGMNKAAVTGHIAGENAAKYAGKSGAVNIDEDEALAKRYNVASSTVVLVHLRDGKEVGHEQLDGVWELSDKREELRSYIAGKIQACFEQKPGGF